MKFEFNWPSGGKQCFNTLMGLNYERTWLKGQP